MESQVIEARIIEAAGSDLAGSDLAGIDLAGIDLAVIDYAPGLRAGELPLRFSTSFSTFIDNFCASF
jgi:hypothetical protein